MFVFLPPYQANSMASLFSDPFVEQQFSTRQNKTLPYQVRAEKHVRTSGAQMLNPLPLREEKILNLHRLFAKCNFTV